MLGKKKDVKKVAEKAPVKKVTANTCRTCKFVDFPRGENVKRGTCRRYPTHTPVMLKSFCGEFA